MRGYACIALDNPKYGENVGGALRAAGCYSADLVVVGGPRFKTLKRFPTDTMKAWKHIPTIEVDDVFDALPHDCVPIAVELLENAKPLPDFQHPERAFYIFGGEDATLSTRIIKQCVYKIAVPTAHCMNLAATVNVVLYDRLAKASIGDPWVSLAALGMRCQRYQRTIDHMRERLAERKTRAA